MDVKEPRDPAVFVVTVRTGGGEDAVRGCVAPVLAAGASPSPKRWFQSLDQVPAIIRSFLNRQSGTQLEADNRRTR
jgi:hypothetical protein